MFRYQILPILSAFLLLSCDSASDRSGANTPEGEHQSSMVIQIHRTNDLPANSPNFMANQIAILNTGNVIDLASKKSTIDAKLIKNSLVIEPLKGTDLIRLTAHNDDAAQAKLTVESLVNAYVDLRKEQWKNRAAVSLEKMDQELRDQGDLIQDYRKALTVLIQQYGIPAFEAGGSKQVGQTEESLYRQAQEKLDQLEQDRIQLKIQIRKLLDTPNEDLARTAAGLDLPENQVTVYYTAYRTAEEHVSALIAGGLGSKHPEVIATKAKAENALKNAGKEVLALKEVLETRLNLVEKQIKRMRQMVQERNDGTVDLSMQQHQYTTAKEEYEQARTMYREMKIKQQERRVSLTTHPDFITIHERAK